MTGVPEIARRFIDGSWVTGVADDGGGGSQPLTKTLTAAEIAARWNVSDTFAAIEWPAFPRSYLAGCIEVANTLDQNCILSQLSAQAPGATSDDVYNNGEGLAAPGVPSPGTYAIAYLSTTLGNGQLFQLAAGAAAFVTVSGDAAPTTGSLTVAVLAYS